MTIPKHTITVLALVVAVMPFLGFPGSFKAPAYFLLGLAIAYASFQEHRQKRKSSAFRRIHRKIKGAVTIPVSGASQIQKENPAVIPSLVEPNEENKTSV